MEYDGIIMAQYVKGNNTVGYSIILNDTISFLIVDSANAGQHGNSLTLNFKKGDELKLNINYTPTCRVAYYKLRDYNNR